jgi:hypothetical protein
MFCSELLTRWYRAGGFNAVAPAVDADHVSPAQFLQSPAFTVANLGTQIPASGDDGSFANLPGQSR